MCVAVYQPQPSVVTNVNRSDDAELGRLSTETTDWKSLGKFQTLPPFLKLSFLLCLRRQLLKSKPIRILQNKNSNNCKQTAISTVRGERRRVDVEIVSDLKNVTKRSLRSRSSRCCCAHCEHVVVGRAAHNDSVNEQKQRKVNQIACHDVDDFRKKYKAGFGYLRKSAFKYSSK